MLIDRPVVHDIYDILSAVSFVPKKSFKLVLAVGKIGKSRSSTSLSKISNI